LLLSGKESFSSSVSGGGGGGHRLRGEEVKGWSGEKCAQTLFFGGWCSNGCKRPKQEDFDENSRSRISPMENRFRRSKLEVVLLFRVAMQNL